MDDNFNPRPHTGATFKSIYGQDIYLISIHVPIRGRLFRDRRRREVRVFQSTPPYGGDILLQNRGNRLGISIHAPIRGRPRSSAVGLALPLFQSTPPYGGDLTSALVTTPMSDFNPRPHTGATCRGCVFGYRDWQFQSTPPYGGDPKVFLTPGYHPDFNPRPHTGATWSKAPSRPSRIFQSTPPYGGDLGAEPDVAKDCISIHAPIRGRRVAVRAGY